jgi:hypothetical protein
MRLTRILMESRVQSLMLGLVMLIAPAAAPAGIDVAISIGPPALPVYIQPPCPTEGYHWIPGYWAYGPAGYYWVPGVWVAPPRVGVLWTPGYWGFAGGRYLWNEGYWGPHVGFYGGVNYGFGYAGVGFIGGAWAGNVFRYNTAVMSVNTAVVRNVYVDRTVIRNTTVVSRASFNGPGGIQARPSAFEQTAMREQHFNATQNQMAHMQMASRDHTQLASVNNGRPGTTAMDSVNGRRFNQQQRIAQGVASGQLTPRETARVENKEANINHQVAADRAANGGKLTPQEHQQINKKQNQASKEIYNEKHNEKRER